MVETIDVAIPVRNEEGMIKTVLQSIYDQELDGRYHFMVTVMPNACTDKTSSVARTTIKRFAKKRQSAGLSFRIWEREEGGKNANLNAALAVSKTKFFMYADGDVIFSPNCFTAVADTLHEPGVVVSGAAPDKILTPETDQVTATFHRIRLLLYGVNQVLGLMRQPVGAMMGFRRALLDEIPTNMHAEDVYITLLAAHRFGLNASRIAPQATVSSIATQTLDDYMAREKRIKAAHYAVFLAHPELKAAYDHLYRYHPVSREEIDALVMPLLKAAGIGREELERWHAAQEEIASAANIEDFLRPDGTWVPIGSTKRTASI